MNRKIITFSTDKIIVDLSIVLYYLKICDIVKLNENYSPDLFNLFNDFINKAAEQIYERNDNICPECGCKMIKNGKTKRTPNKNMDVFYQTYHCNECGAFVKTTDEEYRDKYSNYTNKIKEKGKTLTETGDLSYDTKAELINEDHGTKIHKTTVYRHQKAKTPAYLKKQEEKTTKFIETHPQYLSGILNYDEQWVFINGKLYYRFQKIDAKTGYAYKSLLLYYKDFSPEAVYNYLNENNYNKQPTVIVTDGHSAYPPIVAKLKAKHAKCHFHYLDHVLKSYWTEHRVLKRKITTKNNQIQIKNNQIQRSQKRKQKKYTKTAEKKRLKEKINNHKLEISLLKTEIKEIKKRIKDIEKIKNKIIEFFASKSIKTAKKRFKQIIKSIKPYKKVFPNFETKIIKNWDAITISMENPEIPRTNNQSELYFRTTMPRFRKKTFKTVEGFQQNAEIKRHKWNKKIAKISL